jgi:hypothetical protein
MFELRAKHLNDINKRELFLKQLSLKANGLKDPDLSML